MSDKEDVVFRYTGEDNYWLDDNLFLYRRKHGCFIPVNTTRENKKSFVDNLILFKRKILRKFTKKSSYVKKENNKKT